MSEKPMTLPCREYLEGLVKKANAGDPDAMAALRAYLDKHPQIWQKAGDLSQHVQMNHIREIANGNQLVAESLRQKADWLRNDLLGPNATSLEKVAVEGVMASWFERHAIELKFPPGSGDNLPMSRYVMQLRSNTQRRFDAAMKALLVIKEKMPAIDAANRRRLRKTGKLLPMPARGMS